MTYRIGQTVPYYDNGKTINLTIIDKWNFKGEWSYKCKDENGDVWEDVKF